MSRRRVHILLSRDEAALLATALDDQARLLKTKVRQPGDAAARVLARVEALQAKVGESIAAYRQKVSGG